MKCTCLVALSIFVLSIERSEAFSLGSIFGLGGNDTSDEKDDGPIPSKLSTAEEFIKTLLLPVESVKKVNDVISKLPRKLRDPIESTIGESKNGFGEVLNRLSDKFHAIYPGTLWCGAGDIAENDADLGLFERTDACCRAHDKCSSSIAAGEVKDGLWNNGIFTRSHCSCDSAFYDCLKDAESLIATKIGFTYFDVLRPQCFVEIESNANCTKDSSERSTDNKCEEKNQDQKEAKAKWLDNPKF